MRDDNSGYRRRLRRELSCSGPARRRLLTRFDGMLTALHEEIPSPTTQQLTDAFGPPESLAAELMRELTAAELRRQRIWSAVRWGLLCLLLFSVALFLIYALLLFLFGISLLLI